VYAYVSTHRHSININSIHMCAKNRTLIYTYIYTSEGIERQKKKGKEAIEKEREREKKNSEVKYFHNHISTILYIYSGFLSLFFFLSRSLSLVFFWPFFHFYSSLFCRRHTAMVIIVRMCVFFLYI
jgi:hypothetical protein